MPESTSEKLWRVAVEAPLREPLTYASADNLERGRWVHVPLGKRESMGLVLGTTDKFDESFELKAIKNPDEELPLLHENFVKWLEWMSEYYIYPLGMVAESSRPPLQKKEKVRKSKKPPVVPQLERDVPPQLTAEQTQVVADISSAPGYKTHLIHGVTGSGKTEIYLRMIEKTIAEDKTVLVLVPEISLTPQLIQRFARRFGDKIAALHSQLTDREKTNQWWDVVQGERKILIGARSALFCPQKKLGLIIVDEEHEPSYKQDEKLKYHARDAAIMLGYFHNCPVLLGSATPSLESWHNSQTGKYQLHQLKHRVHTSNLPEVQIVDMKVAKEQALQQNSSLPSWLSIDLYEKIKRTLEEGYQTALFLNRRGMAHVVMCNSCGYSSECPNCDIHLTLHGRSHLVCHYCDYHENFKTQCSSCKTGELTAIGLGTEKLESDLAKLFPDKKILRADRDEIQSREDLENFVAEMESGNIDILVGTQMIAKGLDFPRLKLVGLVLADIGFNMPDFRCNERNFQLIVQMSGRPGRSLELKDSKGEVVIQTFNPEHESLSFAIRHDYEGFANQELIHRNALMYPPYGSLMSLRVQSSEHNKAYQLAQQVGNRARALQNQFAPYKSLEVLGPAEAPMAKLKNQYRYYLLIKGTQKAVLNRFIRQLLGDESWIPAKCRIIVDIDPLQLL
jgi:primosomal protein N' (replication factor Y)